MKKLLVLAAMLSVSTGILGASTLRSGTAPVQPTTSGTITVSTNDYPDPTLPDPHLPYPPR